MRALDHLRVRAGAMRALQPPTPPPQLPAVRKTQASSAPMRLRPGPAPLCPWRGAGSPPVQDLTGFSPQ